MRHLSKIAGLVLALGLAGCVSADRRGPMKPVAAKPVAAKPVAAKPVVAKPAWAARRVVADAVAVPGGRQHIVKNGETGIAIARAYGVEWSKLAAANGLKPPYVLEVGDKLLLPEARVVASMSVEERARAFTLQIDDIITGGEPAAKVAAKPGAGAKARALVTPLPIFATRQTISCPGTIGYVELPHSPLAW